MYRAVSGHTVEEVVVEDAGTGGRISQEGRETGTTRSLTDGPARLSAQDREVRDLPNQ